jgi:hypothetical protein
MGIFIVGAFIACLAGARLIGMLLITIHALAARRGHGSWRVFALSGFAIAGGLGAFGYLAYVRAPIHSGAPTTEDYERALYAAGAVGAALGLGVTALEALRRAG